MFPLLTTKGPNVRNLVVILVWAIVCAVVTGLAQNSLAEEPVGERQVHRWFVPPEHLPEVIKGHVPLRADEFEKLLTAGAPMATRSPIRRVTYAARFSEGHLVDGRALCELVEDELEKFPNGIPLDCKLAMVVDAGEDAAELKCDRSGRTIARLDASSLSAQLQFGWSLANRRPDSTIAEFEFVGVRSPFNTLEIDVPARLELTSSHGIATPGPSSLGQAYRLWTVSLGGRFVARLRIAPSAEFRDGPRIVVDRQVTRHRLSSQGSEIGVELAVSGDFAFDRLTLQVTKGVQITRARFDDLEALIVPVSGEAVVDSGEAGSDDNQFQIEIPARRRTGTLQLFARTNAPVDGSLPQIVPVDLFWKDRSIEVTIPDHLDLSSLKLNDCRWRSSGRDSESHARTIAWQVLSNTGNVSLTARPAESFVTVSLGHANRFRIG